MGVVLWIRIFNYKTSKKQSTYIQRQNRPLLK
nr:MAG TPA: hypothetical protein [Caudoviricetes sp.]